MSKFQKRVAQLVAGGLSLSAAMAQAAIDTTGVTTAITDASAAIAIVGTAVLVAMIGIKVYKWITRAL